MIVPYDYLESRKYSRSLPASKTLVDHLCITVYPEVLCRGSIARCCCRVAPGGRLQSASRTAGENLHPYNGAMRLWVQWKEDRRLLEEEEDRGGMRALTAAKLGSVLRIPLTHINFVTPSHKIVIHNPTSANRV